MKFLVISTIFLIASVQPSLQWKNILKGLTDGVKETLVVLGKGVNELTDTAADTIGETLTDVGETLADVGDESETLQNLCLEMKLLM